MKIVSSIKDLKNFLALEREKGKKVGLVPTMGALHAGHISLVKRCVAENDICVVSDFVNPTQFNDKHDLETYPRTLDADCALLEPVGCDYVFAPSVAEMYPEPDTYTIHPFFPAPGLCHLQNALFQTIRLHPCDRYILYPLTPAKTLRLYAHRGWPARDRDRMR